MADIRSNYFITLHERYFLISQSAIFPCRGFKVIAQAVELRRMMDSQISLRILDPLVEGFEPV